MIRSQFFRKTKFAWKIVFLAALALFLLPNLNAGVVKANGESDQNQRLRDIFRDAQVQVQNAQGETIAELKDGVARQIPDENFEDQVKDIGTILRNGQLNLHGAHMNLVYNLQMELSGTPADDTRPNALRGARGNADALANEVFFDIPLEHNKFLLDLGTKIKFRVEYRFNEDSDSGKSKFPTSNAHISMTTNPKLRSKLLYTKGIAQTYYGSEYGSCPVGLNGCDGDGGGRNGNSKVRIEMALGGSSTDPRNGEFMGLACIFGKAGPNEMVNVMAFNLFGMIGGQTVWADSLGNWRADFGELNSGHTLFGAVRGLGMPYVMQEGLGGCEYEVCMATNGFTGCDCGCDYMVCEATAGLGGCECSPKMIAKPAKIELGLLRDEFRFRDR